MKFNTNEGFASTQNNPQLDIPVRSSAEAYAEAYMKKHHPELLKVKYVPYEEIMNRPSQYSFAGYPKKVKIKESELQMEVFDCIITSVKFLVFDRILDSVCKDFEAYYEKICPSDSPKDEYFNAMEDFWAKANGEEADRYKMSVNYWHNMNETYQNGMYIVNQILELIVDNIISGKSNIEEELDAKSMIISNMLSSLDNDRKYLYMILEEGYGDIPKREDYNQVPDKNAE